MQKILKIINHRDFVLSLSVVVGLLLGKHTRFLADISLYILMSAMIVSTISFSFKSWKNLSSLVRPLVGSFLLTYVLYGLVVLIVAWSFFYVTGYESLWIGFVIITAAPPGPAVIPFSAMLNGDNNFSTTGLLAMYLLAMIMAPTILFVFIGSALISPLMIFWIMLQVIIIPLIVSRFARHSKILPKAQKAGGALIKWLFFLIITPIVGMNRNVFFEEPSILLMTALVFIIIMFLIGFIYNLVAVRAGLSRSLIISSTFMLTIKSAAFAAVVAFRFFEDEPVVAIPAAVLSVFIVLFAVFYSLFVKHIMKWKE